MKPFLTLHGIEKCYGTHRALKGIDLTLHEGEIISLLGVNGAGKTTLSGIIAALHPPTKGDIRHAGRSIYEDLPTYRRFIGYCPQKPNLHSAFTMRENLLFAGDYFGMSRQESTQQIEKLSHYLGLASHLDHTPPTLSGGYKQRFSLARSLMHSPALVILDEPTVALDPHIRRQLWDAIKALKQKGVCVLLTTHYLDEAEALSDRVCLLDKGTIQLISTPHELMSAYQKGSLEEVFLQLLTEQKGAM